MAGVTLKISKIDIWSAKNNEVSISAHEQKTCREEISNLENRILQNLCMKMLSLHHKST